VNPSLDSEYPVSTSKILNRGEYLRKNWFKRAPLGTRWSNLIIRPEKKKTITSDAFGDQMRQRQLGTNPNFRDSGQSSNLGTGTITTSFGQQQLGSTVFTNPFQKKVTRAKKRRGETSPYSPISE